MEPRSIAATMMSLQTAINNCDECKNAEWAAKHRTSLRALCKLLPYGSGIDNGTELIDINTKRECITLGCAYHHMNDVGFYEGWTRHKIRARPSFNGMDITISGPDTNAIKDHLHEVYGHALSQLVFWDSLLDRWTVVS